MVNPIYILYFPRSSLFYALSNFIFEELKLGHPFERNCVSSLRGASNGPALVIGMQELIFTTG